MSHSPQRRPARIERAVAAACMALLCIITFVNVVTRYLTNASFAFTEEVSVFLLVLLTLPLTLLTLGFFLLVINALLLLLVAKLVGGFTVSGFWTALFASLFVSVFSLFLNSLMPDAEMAVYRLPPAGRTISM